MNAAVTLIARKGRITYLPGCPISKAFLQSKLKKQLSVRDVQTLKEMGFQVEYKDEKTN